MIFGDGAVHHLFVINSSMIYIQIQ